MATKSASRTKSSKNIDELKRKNLAANLQWAAIGVVFVLLILAVFVFGWGTGDGINYGGHSG